MRCVKSYAAAVGAAVVALVAIVGTARAELVFGNLGSAGTNPLSVGVNVAISDTTWVMHGFTVGGSDNILQTITLGLFDNDSTTARVQIFADGGGIPSGSALASQTASVNNVTPTLQTFNFGSLPLTSGSTYWAVVSTPTASSLFNWAFNDDGFAPFTQNASGWLDVSPFQTKISSDSGSNWSGANGIRPASISITAVPEPDSLLALGTAAVAIAGGLFRRRRVTA